ncbi:MAG: tetratricopeptide repeat protein [Halobacteria archaeon]|nr:tetratricopeptide repeat protein [Halobacteria archaeon]
MDTEDQQLEELKKWWKENGSSIITGVVLGLAILFGARAWFAWEERTAQQASTIYTVMMNDMQAGDVKAASDNAGVLIADFSSTPYATLAAMLLAKYRIGDNELDAARTQLQWALDNGSDELRDTARVRLARLLISLEDYDTALGLLQEAEASGGQGGVISELRGDIHSVRGESRQAVDAYQEALLLMNLDYPGRHLVQLKFDNAIVLAAPSMDDSQ